MAATEAQVAAATLWLQQHMAAAARIREAAEQAAQATWLGFEAWYSAAAVAALAAESAQLSTASQDVIVGAAQQFIGNTVATLRGSRGVSLPRPRQREIRNGQPLELVHTRPAEAYKRAVATGHTHEESVLLAVARAVALVGVDMSLAERAAWQTTMADLGITQFRRVVRPELSRTGSCGLCIAASDRIYNTAVLMPIHPPSCKCIPMPIVGDVDPGVRINREDLGQLYEDAGSTKADDLRRTRYQVNEHGEFGPVLTRAGNAFRGPGQVALENDPKRAARLLAKALPVLERMESEGAPEGPLEYQRDLVARLTSIAA